MKTFKKRVTDLLTVSVLLLAILLSLTACGSNENSNTADSGKQSETEENSVMGTSANEETSDTQFCDLEDCNMMFPHVHITMDNWQDYFEFTIDYQFGNGAENMDKYILTKTVFNVREEWREKISDLELHYQVGYTEYSVPGTIDWDNHVVTIEETSEKTYSKHIDDQWFSVDSYGFEFNSSIGLTGTHENSMTNYREDYDGKILFWEPEMLSISAGGYIAFTE